MLSRAWFLEEVREKILPQMETNECRQASKQTNAVIIFILLFFIFVFLISHGFGSPKASFFTLFCLLAEVLYGIHLGYQTWGNYRQRKKEKICPFVFNLLDAVVISEKRIEGMSVKQLQKAHFLPDCCTRVKNEVQNDIFGFWGVPLPFSVQEIAFRHKEKKTMFFQGPLVRFSLPKKFDFHLMGFRKASPNARKATLCSAVERMEESGLKKINLNDSFLTFSDDEAGAKRFLTASFLSCIKRVEFVYGAPVNFWLYEDQLILFIKANRDLFEFDSPRDRLGPFEAFYDQVHVLVDFGDLFS